MTTRSHQRGRVGFCLALVLLATTAGCASKDAAGEQSSIGTTTSTSSGREQTNDASTSVRQPPRSSRESTPVGTSNAQSSAQQQAATIADSIVQPAGAQRLTDPAYAPTAGFLHGANTESLTETWRVPGTSQDAIQFYSNHLPAHSASQPGATYHDATHTITSIDISIDSSNGGTPPAVQIAATDDGDSALVSILVEVSEPFTRPASTVIGDVTGPATLRNFGASRAVPKVTASAAQTTDLVTIVNSSSTYQLERCSSGSSTAAQKTIEITFTTKGQGLVVVELHSPPICGSSASVSSGQVIVGLRDYQGVLALVEKIAPQYEI